ncbi:hypothetical protein B0H63DRAFT_306509 [Podospora didyma]|uniref:O-methyltransferase n=1 Tax=Podospora didyma TaxID=330526 RepID=A0AAE0K5Z2_9PEZI|nr:hypothetical protein B0H63DRAFT_306509 [Podospora didyma]
MTSNPHGWNELDTSVQDLVAAAQDLAGYSGTDTFVDSSTSARDISLARRKLCTAITRLQNLVTEPGDFIQHLAHNTQLLACIQWLGEFQVLACIPLSGSVPMRDVADLADVSETQLSRIVRMTATADFLSEPQPGYISHTPLSAPFVTNLSYLDAAMLLAETAAPAALHMTIATQRSLEKKGTGRRSERPEESAYNVAFHSSQTFQSACEQRPKLHRQWLAYLRYVGADHDAVIELLGGLDWFSLSGANIVDVGAHSTTTAKTLAKLNPTLSFIVQLSEITGQQQDGASENGNDGIGCNSGSDGSSRDLSRRIVVQYRTPGSPQMVKDADVYLVRLPSLSAAVGGSSLRQRILVELHTHAEVLRTNTSATLILLLDLLLDTDDVHDSRDMRPTACLRDLSLWQMTNAWGMEMGELMELVNGVQDSMGRLVVTDKLRSRNGATVALHAKYQSKWGF